MRSAASALLVVACLASATCASSSNPPQPAPVTAPAAVMAAREEPASLMMEAAEPAKLAGKEFKPACTVPFGSLSEVRAIDDVCGIDGDGSDATQAQNRVKNNFCASGTPVNFNRQLGERLNTAVDALPNFSWGSPTNTPLDRSPLRDLISVSGKLVGEGSLVRTVAYFMQATFSNTSKGERVNCNETGQANNDIHIYLSMTPEEDDKCESLNAEITPHFRPEVWEEVVGLKISPQRPMRVTGQLMLDAAHRPCANGKRANPGRFTSWEIHPVYNMEVCKNKSKASCRISNDADWIAFDEWLGEDEHEEPPQ